MKIKLNKLQEKLKHIYKKMTEKWENIFLIFIIIIGLFYIFAMVPYQVADEPAHIIRAYEVYNGQFIASLDENGQHRATIPKSLAEYNLANIKDYNDLQEKWKISTDYNDTQEVYTEAQSYCGISYIFSGLGLWIAKILNLNILVGIYLARLFNFAFFVLLGYFAIKKIPFGKMVLTLYMFMPMVIQQATSVSPDAIINAVTIFFIAYVLYLTFKATQISKKEIVMIFGMTIFMAVAKIVYLPLVGLLFLLICNKKLDKKKKLIVIIGSILIGAIVGVSWYLYQSRYVDEREYVQLNNINAVEQIKNIISNPVGFINTLKNTTEQVGSQYLLGLVGNKLGWQSIQVPNVIIIITLFILLISAWFEKNEVSFNWKQRLWAMLISIGIILLVFVAMYLSWTVVGGAIVVGVQGRYFIPVAILILLCLCLKNNYLKIRHIRTVFMLFMVIANIIALNSIINFFS